MTDKADGTCLDCEHGLDHTHGDQWVEMPDPEHVPAPERVTECPVCKFNVAEVKRLRTALEQIAQYADGVRVCIPDPCQQEALDRYKGT
jgi:hypothetical protein